MSPAWINPFLEALKRSGIVARACDAASVPSSAVYALRKRDGDFAAAWDEALEVSYDTLEAEARRRALEGVEEPVVYQGQLTPLWERDELGHVIEDTVIRNVFDPLTKEMVETAMRVPRQQLDEMGRPKFLTIRKHSDALMQFLLKGYRKKFGTDRTELTGADGAPLQLSDTERAARVAQLLAVARQRKVEADEFSDLA